MLNFKGPDFVWHLDGYDKLKPYGFAIHAAIDGWVKLHVLILALCVQVFT